MDNLYILLNQNENPNEQKLQNLKNDLIEQIENFVFEVLKRYDKEHELFTKLNILKIEVESEYVTLENFEIYCNILYELVKRFRESTEETKKEIENSNKELENELQKLTDKLKKIQEIEQIQEEKNKSEKEKKSEQKSSEENDFSFLVGVVIFGFFIFCGLSYFAINFIAAFSEVTIIAATGIFLGEFIGVIAAIAVIGLSIWGIYEGINAFINWYRDRNLRKILQKTQEIKEKIHEDINQEIQIEVEGRTSETIDKEQSLILYIRNDLLIQVEKLKNEVSKKVENEELIQKLNDLEASIRGESSSLENFKKLNSNLFDFTKEVFEKNFASKIKNLVADLNLDLGGVVLCFSLSGLPIGLIVLPISFVSPLAAMIVLGILVVSVISTLIYASVVGNEKNKIVQIRKNAQKIHKKILLIEGKQNELMPEQSDQQQQNQSFISQQTEQLQQSPQKEVVNQDEIENNFP